MFPELSSPLRRALALTRDLEQTLRTLHPDEADLAARAGAHVQVAAQELNTALQVLMAEAHGDPASTRVDKSPSPLCLRSFNALGL